MKCLLKGVTDFDGDVKPILVEAAFKAMDELSIEKMFLGLDEDQQKIYVDESEKRLKDIKPKEIRKSSIEPSLLARIKELPTAEEVSVNIEKAEEEVL